MDLHTIECSYCGSKYTEWDHLRPLVEDKMPTGYISEIQNLVPSCGKCNQSKGNKDWLIWVNSEAKLSPKSRNIKDLRERIEKLKNYSRWREPTIIDFPKVVDSSLWEKHWSNCNQIQELLINAQETSEKIKNYILSNSSHKYNTPLKNIDKKLKPSDTTVKIGKLVQSYIPELLNFLSNTSPQEIKRLKDIDYSKTVFQLNFPFLKEVEQNSPKLPRYWKKVYTINGKYYVITSEWYDRHREKFKLYIRAKGLSNS